MSYADAYFYSPTNSKKTMTAKQAAHFQASEDLDTAISALRAINALSEVAAEKIEKQRAARAAGKTWIADVAKREAGEIFTLAETVLKLQRKA